MPTRTFTNGESRCIIIESQPAGKATMHWRIVDAAAGQLCDEHIIVRDLLEMQPWGTGGEVANSSGRRQSAS